MRQFSLFCKLYLVFFVRLLTAADECHNNIDISFFARLLTNMMTAIFTLTFNNIQKLLYYNSILYCFSVITSGINKWQ